MSTLTVVVGNPQSASRTSQIAEGLASRIATLTGAEVLPTIELADHAGEMFDWGSETVGRLNEQLASSDYAVIASPTYKASYTGLLKAFLDRYPTNGLAGLTAVPVFTIGGDAHALAVEFTLRPLLVELGASVPTRGLSFATPRFDDRETILDEWIAAQGEYLRS
ncbi:MAG: NADPH-dependent oxidoreductase [Candidatus Leucobacter sulfamidivorax]|nr:NADPH-dependent oxidoreductase [Candidatus Leucobacter sulfamidivorax]